MLRNKQYYDVEGTQLAEYFMEIMNITQTVNGSFSHKGTKNMDEAGKDTGIDPAFAGYDGVISWKQTTGDMTGILFSSNKPIKTSKLGKQFVNILYWHDNDTSDLYKGKKFTQGQKIYDEGAAGRATGNHIHFGVSIGEYKGGYPLVKNEFGNWELPNEVNPWDVFFVDDTIIKNGGGAPWIKYEPSVKPKEEVESVTAPVAAPEVPKTEVINVGDRVKVLATNYTNGLVVPKFVHKNTYTIKEKSRDGKKVLISGINSWVFVKDVRKAG